MPKCHCNFIEITLWDGCSSVNLLHIFRTPFPKNTSGRLLLERVIYVSINKQETEPNPVPKSKK